MSVRRHICQGWVCELVMSVRCHICQGWVCEWVMSVRTPYLSGGGFVSGLCRYGRHICQGVGL